MLGGVRREGNLALSACKRRPDPPQPTFVYFRIVNAVYNVHGCGRAQSSRPQTPSHAVGNLPAPRCHLLVKESPPRFSPFKRRPRLRNDSDQSNLATPPQDPTYSPHTAARHMQTPKCPPLRPTATLIPATSLWSTSTEAPSRKTPSLPRGPHDELKPQTAVEKITNTEPEAVKAGERTSEAENDTTKRGSRT